MSDRIVLCFSRRRELLGVDGWDALRYYSEEGITVRDLLSFEHVHDINPFEVGVDHRREKRVHSKSLKWVVDELRLSGLMEHPFNSLSNGETHRALLAEAILKRPARLTVIDPMSGLDPAMRQRVGEVISQLPARGIAVTCRYRYHDEASESAVPANARQRASAQNGKACSCDNNQPPVVEIGNLQIKYGRRRLFSGLDWTVRRGERWVLRGPNGSGKTTLIALITGDCPLAYANDIKVFGIPRECGRDLLALRRRIGWLSPELQASTGLDAFALLDAALVGKPELLLLDEPCMNLSAGDARKMCRRIDSWLRRHPDVTAVCVAHRDEHIPSVFDRELALSVP